MWKWGGEEVIVERREVVSGEGKVERVNKEKKWRKGEKAVEMEVRGMESR